MDAGASLPLPELSPETLADIRRIQAIWTDCRSRYGAGGPFLFGGWSIADAMFAPVVTRFRTFGVTLDADSEAYAAAVMGHPAVKEWIDAARNEPWLIESCELT